MRSADSNATYATELALSDVLQYLHAKGWKERWVRENIVGYWRNRDFPRTELHVPRSKSLEDFDRLLIRLFQDLAEAENRDVPDIVEAASDVTRDIVRVRFVGKRFASGEAPLSKSTDIVEESKRMLIAAALSTVEAKAAYYSGRPNSVESLIENSSLGQTERGSFVVKIKGPRILPENLDQETLFFDPEAQKSVTFSRQVFERLADSLSRTKSAISSSLEKGTYSPFVEAIENGVSANLLDSLVGFTERASATSAEVSIAWTPVLGEKPKKDFLIAFSEVEAATLRNASDHLRSIEPDRSFKLQGVVTALENLAPDLEHIVKVTGVVDGRIRRVQVLLSPEDYRIALETHPDHKPIEIEGVLERSGRSYRMTGVSSVRVSDEEENAEPANGNIQGFLDIET